MVAVEQTMDQQQQTRIAFDNQQELGQPPEQDEKPPELVEKQMVTSNEELRLIFMKLSKALKFNAGKIRNGESIEPKKYVLDVSKLAMVGYVDQELLFLMAKEYPKQLEIIGLPADLVGLSDVMNITLRQKDYERPR